MNKSIKKNNVSQPIKFFLTSWLAFFIPNLSLAQETFETEREWKQEKYSSPSTSAKFKGLFGEILMHESGHGVAAFMLGWKIQAFRPFPHFCGGRLVGGCVISSPDAQKDSAEYTTEATLVSAAGSLTSIVSVLALAPQLSQMENKESRDTLYSMLYYQTRDFPFYVLVDLLTGFNGDWAHVSKLTGVPLWALLPVAGIQYYYLDRYLEEQREKALDKYYGEDYATYQSKIKGTSLMQRPHSIQIPLIRIPLP